MEHVTLTDVLNGKSIDECIDRVLIEYRIVADDVEVEKKTCVTIDEWIDVWGTLVGNKKKLDDFPMWLQYYPKILFNVINRAGKVTGGYNTRKGKVNGHADEREREREEVD